MIGGLLPVGLGEVRLRQADEVEEEFCRSRLRAAAKTPHTWAACAWLESWLALLLLPGFHHLKLETIMRW